MSHTGDVVVIKLVTESVQILSHTRYIGIGDVLLSQKLSAQQYSDGVNILDKRLDPSISLFRLHWSKLTAQATKNQDCQIELTEQLSLLGRIM